MIKVNIEKWLGGRERREFATFAQALDFAYRRYKRLRLLQACADSVEFIDDLVP